MNHLNRIWKDIQRGENIDLYTTVVLAVVLAILSVIGVASQPVISSLTLTILALLAYSILGNRHQIESTLSQLAQSSESILKRKWPEDILAEDLTKSKDILMIGVSLNRTVRNNYSLFEARLKEGARIRVLLVNPNSAALEIAANRPYANVDVERTRNGVAVTLKSLSTLKQTTKGNLEVRVLNNPLAIGGFILDGNASRGVLYLEHYTFKMREEDVPKLVLRPEDGYWFDFFVKQTETLWENGSPQS